MARASSYKHRFWDTVPYTSLASLRGDSLVVNFLDSPRPFKQFFYRPLHHALITLSTGFPGISVPPLSYPLY
jgi:hypothetical protein